MGTKTSVTVAEYLRTSYRPDCDYVDGEVRERNVGEWEHSRVQTAIAIWLGNHEAEWSIHVVVEQRVQVVADRFRIPDVCVTRSGERVQRIVRTPPLVCIEVLSRDDTLRDMRERVNDYLNLGVEHVWLLDPAAREAFICTKADSTRRVGAN